MKKSKLILSLVAAGLIGGATIPSVTANAYTIDTTFLKTRSTQRTSNQYVIAHETATYATARENAQYMNWSWNSNEAYTAYVVGDGGHVYQVSPDGLVQWGAGGVANSRSPVQVELARTKNAAQFSKDYAVYVNLLRDKAKKYNIPVTLDGAGNGIKSHLWVTNNLWGNHTDPYGYLASMGVSKSKFAADLQTGLKENGTAINATQSQPSKPTTIENVNVTYALRTKNGAWLSDVTNVGSGSNGFAGIPNHEHDYLTVRVDRGSIKYQVHTQKSGWLPYVSASNKGDLVNGAAGVTGQAIDGVRIYYTTPSGKTYQQAWYRSQTVKRSGYLGTVVDDGNSLSGYRDTYAGIYGESLDRLQIKIGTSNPF
jgi:N-acetylmuramoyl-L-alanine amidase